ncbi:hypothetical protein V1J52_25335 [Streptomyces sp. TRM 70351]|uniref:hypothetical protein n=1 Tax=Streptomyces sp. TRM 70351 TaxID=3116552 RepID=UPI002E7C4EFB|nr:hypothetical protein [Streptomyces sp. TRM 70351]MEE1931447.1 hypothetical protein [Streptomyces sp. TRM 70351]
MKRPIFRRCSPTPSTLTPEDQATVDAFRAMLAAVRAPQPWTPGCGQDVAVRVGPFIERAHPRPGDDHGTEMIAISLVHPDTGTAAAYGEEVFQTLQGQPLDDPTRALAGPLRP